MFWSSPGADIKVMVFLLIVSLIIAIATYVFSKRMKLLVSVFVLSVLSNLILYYGIDYNFAKIYEINWLFIFSKNVWPVLNIALLVLYLVSIIKNRYAYRNDI